MKSKLIQIPYTIGIIKPHLVLRDDLVSFTPQIDFNMHLDGTSIPETGGEPFRYLPPREKDIDEGRGAQSFLPIS